MSIEARYHEQVRLLVALLPFLNAEPCFALKGGTAINLFVQPFPRLSVDDVKLLLDQGGLDRGVFEGGLVYLLGHPRPMNEVINPRMKPLEAIYRKEFVGMAITDISLPSWRKYSPGCRNGWPSCSPMTMLAFYFRSSKVCLIGRYSLFRVLASCPL